MSTTPQAPKPSTLDHDAWRVILTGRTGLDQALRRDRRIELIRCRTSIDAIGELGDPIDENSPSRAIVIIAPDAEPDGPERGALIDALRLVDPSVRILRAGAIADGYDGCIDPASGLETMIHQIENSVSTQPDQNTTLRFVDPDSDQRSALQSEPEPDPEPEEKPQQAQPQESPHKVEVVVENETFTHRAQGEFESQCELHKRVILSGSEESLHKIDPPTVSEPLGSRSGMLSNDAPLVEAMLRGVSILDAAVSQINDRLGRSDITLLQPGQGDPSLSVPVLVGERTLGELSCPDEAWLSGQGRALLFEQSKWLAVWIRLEAQQCELRRCAFTDALTDAWNRRYFDRFLTAAIEQSRQARQPLTVMLFDIDSFKHYNDTYGHSAGDEILIETVKLLKSVIRPSDRVCRVGGDEFAVIFYEPQGPRDPSSKPLESVYQIATRFQKQICKHRFPKLGVEALGTLTISGGLASFPWDGHDASSLLEQADRLAMESKQQGKNALTLGPGADSVCRSGH